MKSSSRFRASPQSKPKLGRWPRLLEIALLTEDVAGLTNFYERLLDRPPDSRSDSHASFDLEGTTLFIHVACGDHSHGVPSVDHVALGVDQDAAVNRARSAGVEVTGPTDYYWGRSAYLRDPDGRVVEVQSD